MANTIPITIQMGALPPQVRATPQQLADMMVARMSLVTAQTFALFVSGSTAPLSNAGPWFNTNTNSWWVWSDTDGAYIPEPVFIPSNYPVRAVPTATQTIPIDNAKHKVLFATEIFDPENAFASSRYTAAVDGIYAVGCNLRVDNNGGAAALMDLQLEIWRNGTTFMGGAGNAVASPPGSRWYPNLGYQLISMSAGDYIEIFLTAQDGTNAANVDVTTASYLNIGLFQAT